MARSLLILPAVVSLLALASHAPADGWGTIKGQFVMADGKVPTPVKLVVDKNQEHCLSKGPLYSDLYAVDPKTRGVRWVVVWISVDSNGKSDPAAVPPIHPSLEKIPDDNKQVVMDQPCCKFEPPVVVLRKGQDFVGKNSSPVAHNMLIAVGAVNENLAIPAGKQIVIPAEKWKPYRYAGSVKCTIHPWMGAKMFVLGHPYFAISDAEGKFEIKNVPAGKFRLHMLHEVWVNKKDGDKPLSEGAPVTVEADKVLDLGKVLVPLPAKD